MPVVGGVPPRYAWCPECGRYRALARTESPGSGKPLRHVFRIHRLPGPTVRVLGESPTTKHCPKSSRPPDPGATVYRLEAGGCTLAPTKG